MAKPIASPETPDVQIEHKSLTRRKALQIAGIAAVASIVPIAEAKSKKKKSPAKANKVSPYVTAPTLFIQSSEPDLIPKALHRIAFGPAPGDVDRVRAMGLEAYLHEQLHPVDSDDPILIPAMQSFTMRIAYGKGKIGKTEYPAVNEERPFTCLDKTAAELYPINSNTSPYPERERPLDEVKAAKFLRGIYSKWQTREVMVDFWHNHFSVDAYIDDNLSRIMFPVYDRDAIRKNSLGNFRELLGSVAKSQPMLIYLNNYTSKASPANENFARELFELHTLGAEHYYNNLYQEWSKVPGALKGHPEGYIDQDVYEAARAFTGWTIANGSYGRDGKLPSTGEFLYYDGWHDPYQKRVLANDFDPYQPPMSDGERVLDLVAYHPGTAHFVCKKICKRLISPTPPESVVEKATHTWMAYQKDPLQIARVIHTIVMSPEFNSTWAKGIKLPFEAMVAHMRATGAKVKPDGNLFGQCGNMGERMFNWPTPNGRPYDAEHWTGTMGILARWNTMRFLSFGRKGFVDLPDPLPMPDGANNFDEVCRFWEHRMLGRDSDSNTHQILVEFMTNSFPRGIPDSGSRPYQMRTRDLIAMISMSPDFHIR